MEKKIHPAVEKIKMLMEESEMSEYELAKKAELSRSTVGRILAGESSPALENIDAMARVFGLTITLKKLALQNPK